MTVQGFFDGTGRPMVEAKIDGLDDPHDVGGIGGTIRMYSVPAAVCLSDGDNERSFEIPIGIPDKIEDSAGYEEMPSLLGRDIINRSVMIYDSLRRKLEFVFLLPTAEEHLTCLVE